MLCDADCRRRADRLLVVEASGAASGAVGPQQFVVVLRYNRALRRTISFVYSWEQWGIDGTVACNGRQASLGAELEFAASPATQVNSSDAVYINAWCSLTSIQTSTDGFIGSYGQRDLPQTSLKLVLVREALAITSAPAQARQLQSESRVLTEIRNPIICVEPFDSVVFSLQAGASWPVYDKDSLLNSNPNFDFGPFRRLNVDMQNGANITSFIHTFTTAGVHVFLQAPNTEKVARTIVRVVPEGIQCPSSTGTVLPTSEQSLILIGIKVSNDVLTDVDWNKVMAVVFTLLVICCSVVIASRSKAVQDWTRQERPSMEYRRENALADLGYYHAKGGLVTLHMAKPDDSEIVDSNPLAEDSAASVPTQQKTNDGPLQFFATSPSGISCNPLRMTRTLRLRGKNVQAWDDDEVGYAETMEAVQLHRQYAENALASSIGVQLGILGLIRSQFDSLHRRVLESHASHRRSALLAAAGSDAAVLYNEQQNFLRKAEQSLQQVMTSTKQVEQIKGLLLECAPLIQMDGDASRLTTAKVVDSSVWANHFVEKMQAVVNERLVEVGQQILDAKKTAQQLSPKPLEIKDLVDFGQRSPSTNSPKTAGRASMFVATSSRSLFGQLRSGSLGSFARNPVEESSRTLQAADGWGVDSAVSLEKLTHHALFSAHTHGYDIVTKIEGIRRLVQNILDYWGSIEELNTQHLQLMWMHATAHNRGSQSQLHADLLQIQASADAFTKRFKTATEAFVVFLDRTHKADDKLRALRTQLSRRASEEAVSLVKDVFETNSPQTLRLEAFVSDKTRDSLKGFISSCWAACCDLMEHLEPVLSSAADCNSQVAASLAHMKQEVNQSLSQLSQEARAEGLSQFTFNRRLQQLEELVSQLHAQQYYGGEGYDNVEHENAEYDEGEYYEEQQEAEYSESAFIPPAFELNADEHIFEVQNQEMEELNQNTQLSEDAKNRLINDLSDDANELQYVLQQEYEHQQAELAEALEQNENDDSDEQMRRFLHEAEFIEHQEEEILRLDEEQEAELEDALAALLSDDDDEGTGGQFFRAATWDGQTADLSEYMKSASTVIELDGIDQALLDAERIKNERNAEVAKMEAQQQREQTRQLQALQRKLDARNEARLAALDRKLAADAELGYSEADTEYLAGEARVTAHEQAAVDEAQLVHENEIAKTVSAGARHEKNIQIAAQSLTDIAAKIVAAEEQSEALLQHAEDKVQVNLDQIVQRLQHEIASAVNLDERERLQRQLAQEQEKAATSLAAATAEVQQRLIALQSALRIEQANSRAKADAHKAAELLNTQLRAQAEKHNEELATAKAKLREQYQAELEQLRLQQQNELSLAESDKEAEALAAKHQLEEEQLKSSSLVERHDEISKLEQQQANEKASLRDQVEAELTRFGKQQTAAQVARAEAQKAQLQSMHEKLIARQQRRAAAMKKRHDMELKNAERAGEDVAALKSRQQTESASIASEEATIRARIQDCNTSEAEQAAVQAEETEIRAINTLVESKLNHQSEAALAEARSAELAREHLAQVNQALQQYNQNMAAGQIEEAAQSAFEAASSLADQRQRGELERVRASRQAYLDAMKAERRREEDLLNQAKIIQERFMNEQKNVVQKVGTEKQRQANAAYEKMMERKKRRAAAVEKKQAEQRKKMLEERAEKLKAKLDATVSEVEDGNSAGVAVVLQEVEADIQSAPPLQESEEALEAAARHDSKIQALRDKHAKELEELKRAAAEQAQKAASDAAEAAERRRQERLEILAKEMDEQQQWGSSSEQVEAIKKQYQKNVEQLEAALSDEKERQQRQLEAQLAIRRQAQLRKAQKRQALEITSLEQEKGHQIATIESENNKKRDLAALRRVLSTSTLTSAREKGAAIEGVLRKRHADETRTMLERQFNERNGRLKAAVGSILQDKAAEKREMLAMLELSGATAEELEAAIVDLNEKFSHSIQISKQEILSELEAKHAAQLAELRRSQMAELTDAFAQLSPQDVLRRQQAAEREEQAAQMEAMKKRLLLEREKKLETAARLREQKQLESQRAKDAAHEKLRLEMEAHIKAEEKRAELQLKRQQERMELEAKDRMQMQLDMHEGDEEYKEQLMREFKDNQAAMSLALSTERQRQSQRMHQRLAKRKERRLRAEERRLNQASRDAEKAELTKKTGTRTRGAVNEKSKRPAKATGSTPVSRVTPQRSARTKPTPQGRPPRPQAMQSASQAGAMKSVPPAIMNRVQKIEQLLQTLTEQSAAILPMQQMPAQPLADVFEAHLTPGTALVLLGKSNTSAEVERMLTFSKELFATLAKNLNSSERLAKCDIVAAAELPPALSDANAFRRSYFYDMETNVLYVIQQRLSATHGLPAVLIHAAAHILSDPASMGPDSSTAFKSMHTEVTRTALSHLVNILQPTHQSPLSASTFDNKSVLSPARDSARGDVPQLTLDFGPTTTAGHQAESPPSGPKGGLKRAKSERAARLFRSLSSKSKLFVAGGAAAARKRAAGYKLLADTSQGADI